ncbi:AAA family ATPase [Ruminococcus flavefaciens]|uniref:AAA family ATPase n=1 Tax=Ruminococcus flavefaciens TaxID=1265 RepID=UPI00048FCA04|nr:ATP-binding protein [Ruminococcus flavefaciens]
MLISLKVNNCFIYNTETEFTMRSDMRNKHFPSNVVSINSTNVLKSAIIMGPNNVGKTNFIKCINAIRGIMLNEGTVMTTNIFTDNTVSEFAITFCDNEYEYCFELKYDFPKNDYIYEKFSKITYDVHKNRKETVILLRDTKNKEYVCNTFHEEEKQAVISAMKFTAKNNILIYLLDTSQFSVLTEIKDIITSFAKKIDIVDMNNIPMKKTIEMLKMSDKKTKRIVNFILNADLYLENYQFLNDDEFKKSMMGKFASFSESNPQEKVLQSSSSFMDQLHLFSTYKGLTVPSIVFDSTGTKKIACLASYVIEALESGHILVVDELDNSLHFKLVRAIIAMFNNELNTKAQLICTVHDVTLLDCQKLFRKEQIWFAHKDMDNAYLYSLSEFTAEKDGVRDTSDLIEKYKRGVFGALPEPDLFESLLEVQNNG